MSIRRTRTRRLRARRPVAMIRMMVALLAVAAGWSVAAAGALAASTPVSIGVVLPLSGSSATAGQAAEHGAQLAVQEANRGTLVPGVTFSIVARSDTDAAGAPSGAAGASQIKGLIGNGRVAGIVAPFDTGTALAELPLANRAPLATVSPSASDTCLTITAALGCTGSAAELATVQPTGRTTFFRIVPSDAMQGPALADVLFNDGHDKTAYVIDDTSPVGTAQGTAFVQRWQSDGGSLLGHASVAPQADFFNLLTQIAALRPDVIVYTGRDANEPRQLRKQMLEVPALINTPFAATSIAHTAAFAAAIGAGGGGRVWAVAPAPELARLPSGGNFTTNYQAKFGTPSIDAARGYDSAQALLLAVKSAIAAGTRPPGSAGSSTGAFRTAVIAALARTGFTGAEGHIGFAPNGDLQQGPVEVDQLGTVAGVPGWVPGPVVQVAGPAPAAALTPSALDFGSVATGSSSELTLRLSNTGILPLGVSSVTVSGAGFQLAGTTCTSANLLPSGQCAITVRFAPGAAGKLTGKVTVVDTAGTALQTTPLSGTAVVPLVLPAAVYVANGGNSSVRAFDLPLGLNQSPTSTLAGPDTQLDGTGAVALDKFGDVYVANADSESITVYRGNATGDTQPLAVLSGPDTGIANPSAITLDAQGRLYVANAAAGTVTVYAPGASGDATPIRTISGLAGPDGLVLDGTGNLWVANAPTNTLERFGPSDLKPAATIAGSATQLDGPQSLALDAAGEVVVADEYSSAITAYAPTANGDATPSYSIAGAATGLDFPVGLDVDANGNLYVSNFFANTITVYRATARGNAAPVATLSGSTTGLAAPEHLAVSPPLAVLTHTLPPARANRRYHARLIATFGVGRSHWTIQHGRLPRGLRLHTGTGVLTGIPRTPGTYHVRVRVTDDSHPANTAIRSLTLTVRNTAEPNAGGHRHRRNH